MPRSIFGWSLPPGCSQRDIDNSLGQEPSQESQDVLGMIEKMGKFPDEVSQGEIDAVVKTVDDLVSDRERALYLLACAVNLLPTRGPEPPCNCKIPDSNSPYCDRHDTGWEEPTIREEIQQFLKEGRE